MNTNDFHSSYAEEFGGVIHLRNTTRLHELKHKLDAAEREWKLAEDAAVAARQEEYRKWKVMSEAEKKYIEERDKDRK